ncbi:MAG TPA: polysaccharide deacetylase family protein [Candidatus Eremiobacteraceae bacterium]|nr:polysaccharide deacetylase family protein [Candidatus Eremiobacteraceae bacterium]
MKLALVLLSLLAFNAAAFSPGRVPATIVPVVPQALSAEQADAPDFDPGLGYGRYGEVWRVRMERKEIALTFDDGPYPFYTPVLLHVLERSHVPATFFIVGRCAQEFPELVSRIVQSGDEIGNHTFNHYTLTSLSDEQIANQIATDGALLQRFTGKPLSLFRPPHGRFNRHVVAIAQELGYHTIFWSAAADDVKDIPPEVITQRVLREAGPGGIVLLHSGQYRTIEALPDIIDALREQGYTFVTVSKLLEDGEQP